MTNLKKCSKCGNVKLLHEFRPHSNRPDGRDSVCKPCAREYLKQYRAKNRIRLNESDRRRWRDPVRRAEMKASARKWRERNREKHTAARKEYARKNSDVLRWKRIAKTYGLTKDAYMALVRAQGGLCACCHKGQASSHGENLFVDHKHGEVPIKVRGLLCHHCNAGIGSLGDDEDGVSNSFIYLLTRGEIGPEAISRVLGRLQEFVNRQWGE